MVDCRKLHGVYQKNSNNNSLVLFSSQIPCRWLIFTLLLNSISTLEPLAVKEHNLKAIIPIDEIKIPTSASNFLFTQK